MQTSSFFQFQLAPGAQFSGTRQPNTVFVTGRKRPVTMAFRKDGKMVDENMTVLRERIRKMKVDSESGSGGDRVPENWMQWEKMYVNSGCYHSDVYEVVAFLQRFLVESRPIVALGLVALLVVGGSTAGMTILHLLAGAVYGY